MLSVALLGGLALNGVGSPLESMEAHAQTPSSPTWLTLEDGSQCRSWSGPLATSAQPAPLSPIVMNTNSDVVPLTSPSQSDSALTSALGSASEALTFNASGSKRQTAQDATHCFRQWRISSDGRLVSGALFWVPSPASVSSALVSSAMTLANPTWHTSSRALALEDAVPQPAAPVQTKVTVAAVLVLHAKTPPPAPRTTTTSAPTQSATFYTAPGGIGPWTPVPGHPSYAFPDYAGDPNSFMYGSCTWWGAYMRRDEPALGSLGMAYNWIANARAKGMSVGSAPVAGATVVFQPGVEGAGSGGHVAHVEQLLGGGWFIISEMNFFWNGGGWGRVDYRYVHAGSGVAFIY